MNKKKILLYALLGSFFVSLLFGVIGIISYLSSIDTQTDNYFNIGKIKLSSEAKNENLKIKLCVAYGTSLKFNYDIPVPYDKSLKWLFTTEYAGWSQKVCDYIARKTINKNYLNQYSTKVVFEDDKNFFTTKPVILNVDETFQNNVSTHLFLVIYNEAHLKNDPKKLQVKENYMDIEVLSKLEFEGNTTSRKWSLLGKHKVDLFSERYRTIKTYAYNKATKSISMAKRSIDLDMIIVDLGFSTEYENNKNNWIHINNNPNKTFYLFNLMKNPYLRKIDTSLITTKAFYKVKFNIPKESSTMMTDIFLE